ncbi:1-(5-phosphoribosyl)-5-[(5-phosphoribosylamino)methylideneamino]imidazole-4-carboxamide isomerase [Alicyclobacillus cycloheptanicus]|uniref:1-(5-phosphoribosyl)-5-[(5-phosphoribosylamino)methylideneamino] imidazole-4-carboxamide isomerase n=1 Tax=Alicyclobacillus cycloheptanicus TaxID=1457 RepID=A0ABT9XJS8_9BACL|nr:1-(5-phosphoribosyl)-5-[(5-phosphoribosylamino)methylideneamino]imidazole-4-carboxamide isomerase [Alicyclobacillus cycloheptanicus]MDQ0190038.1 phosphoribosylformimino-5-aminoimidazole carboxamide ribotide isomerase [Alicyclobacillus cycloheptanicus]WDM00061.1 1-(5-phosphoribosyl)-5-[(5-phosphoribosylamino)methylideneamino]imidazole-4-carboxamide isomerase [Alicyclobacillus cycloheptanicus]
MTADTRRSPFEVYPAIDILGGKCVRLREGDYGQATQYNDDPVAVAHQWLAAGARWIHVVDLDGARDGRSLNEPVIGAIVREATQCGARVQVGGGIRTHQALEAWLAAGVSRCILGTVILDTTFMAEAVRRVGGAHLVAGLDGRDGKLAVRGWLDQTEQSLVDVASALAHLGVQTAIVTDVRRDGTLQGANVAWARDLQRATGMRCIASGGVRGLGDVQAAMQAGLAGIIVGKALYDGRIDLEAALSLAAKGDGVC